MFYEPNLWHLFIWTDINKCIGYQINEFRPEIRPELYLFSDSRGGFWIGFTLREAFEFGVSFSSSVPSVTQSLRLLAGFGRRRRHNRIMEIPNKTNTKKTPKRIPRIKPMITLSVPSSLDIRITDSFREAEVS